jgi:hypothetical protein
MTYDADGRPTNLNAPTAEQQEQWRQANAEARRAFEQRLRDEEAAKTAAHASESEAALKRAVRLKYAALSDADFERIFPLIRDAELLEFARQAASADHAARLAALGSPL